MLQPKTKVQPNQQTAIPVLFKPSNVKSDQQSIDLRGYIVGQIMVKDSDRHNKTKNYTKLDLKMVC